MFMRRLIVGLVLSLFGSAIFTFWLSTKLRGKPEVKLHYLAPVANMDAGQPITKEQLKPVDWPAGTPLVGAFTKPEDLVGRVVLYPISAGEPILDRALAGAGTGAGLVTHIPDGMRAISLKSDAVTGVAGYLLPGTHIDVLVTYKITNIETGIQGPLITYTVLQDVPILTAGQQMQPDPTGKAVPTDVVTLLVNPEEAEKATIASAQNGSIHFALRNGTDHERMTAEPLQLVSVGTGTQLPGASYQGGRGASSAPAAKGVFFRGPVQGSLTASQTPVPHADAKPVVKGYQVQTIIGNKQSVETF